MARTASTPIIIASLLFICAAALCVLVGVRLNAANFWVMHSYDVILGTHTVVGDIERAQMDARGYIFSNDQQIYRAFKADEIQIYDDIAHVRNLVSDNPEQLSKVAELERNAKARMEACNQLITAFRQKPANASALLHSPEGLALVTNAHPIGDPLLATEQRLLNERSEYERSIELMALPVIGFLGLTALAMLLFSLSSNHRLLNEERHRAAELEKTNAELAESQHQLLQARDKALEASALKSAFVANISHEIRTPLSGIIGMNELLLDSELSQDQMELARTVQESSLSLLTVLNDILDLSKIEAGKMSFTRKQLELKSLVDEAVRLMSAAAAAKGLDLYTNVDSHLPDVVVGDPERIRQVLLNLIGNAVKFTERGSITVQASVVSKGENTVTVRFSVSDTGIGISEEDRRYLFVPFAQVDNSSTRRFGGTGLGLAICRRLVSRMGGEMHIQSEPGVGSTFSFVLPFDLRAQAGKLKAIPESSPRANTDGHRFVLIVEDNPVLQHLAVMQLTNLGLSSHVARTGAEAIEAATNARFDLIFMDVHLPKMSGFEVTKKIREIDARSGGHTPVIAMTAGAMEGDRERCLEEGMDDYLSKPVSIDAMRRMVEKWLGTEREPGQSKTA